MKPKKRMMRFTLRRYINQLKVLQGYDLTNQTITRLAAKPGQLIITLKMK